MTGEFGDLVRGLRRAAGMSQRELAERSGLSERTVRRLESADPGDTRIGTVKLIADALELAPQERRTLMAGAAADDPVELPAQREWPVQAGPPVDDGLSDAARRLAHIVQARWKREEGQRGVHDPFPLPVRWRPVPADLADRWDNICRLPPGEKAQPIDLTGKLPDIAQVYRAVPSGRLVVLGEAGSGKSVLAIRFVLDHLDTRSPAEPVPVIFTLGGWDPGTPLHDWLVDRLLRDDPGLLAPAPSGSTLAAALVEAGRVLPVLDGFDELPEGLRAPAMAALNQTSLPMLLTSRPEEYAAVGTVLNWSAGVRLDDLTPTDLAHYLPRASRDADSWDPLIADLPDPLAGALRTPLMVTLARAHRDSPAALADPALDTTEAVEEHLLAGFVPAVYQDDRRWPLERVQHWLGHLARVGPVEVAWWRLGETLSRATRILAVVLASSLVTALVDIAVSLPLMLAAGLGVGSALLDGLLIGPIVGLGFGLIYGLLIVLLDVRIAPSRVRLRLGRGRVRVAPTVPTRMLAGFCGGFLVGVGYGPVSLLLRGIATGFGPLDVVIRLAMVNSLMIGLAFGLAVGAVLGVVALLESPHDLTSATGPLTILAANRATAIRTVLLFAPLLSLALYVSGVLVVAVFDGVFADLVWEGIGAAVISTVGGISGAVSYALAFTAWGQWLVLTRVCLPLMGRLPWSVTTFLTDAHARGVLRQTGAVYQFRHDRLRTHLTR